MSFLWNTIQLLLLWFSNLSRRCNVNLVWKYLLWAKVCVLMLFKSIWSLNIQIALIMAFMHNLVWCQSCWQHILWICIVLCLLRADILLMVLIIWYSMFKSIIKITLIIASWIKNMVLVMSLIINVAMVANIQVQRYLLLVKLMLQQQSIYLKMGCLKPICNMIVILSLI